MATIKFWSEMTKATTVDGEDKVMISRNSTGEAMYADFQYLINQAGMNSSDYIPVDGNTLPDGGEGNKVTFAGPGTYTQSGGDDVVVPENSLGIITWDGDEWSLGSSVAIDIPADVVFHSELKDAIESSGILLFYPNENLLKEYRGSNVNNTDLWSEGYLNKKGEIVENSSWVFSVKYIPFVTELDVVKTELYFSGSAVSIVYYDNNKKAIGFQINEGASPFQDQLIAPEGTVYLRFSHPVSVSTADVSIEIKNGFVYLLEQNLNVLKNYSTQQELIQRIFGNDKLKIYNPNENIIEEYSESDINNTDLWGSGRIEPVAGDIKSGVFHYSRKFLNIGGGKIYRTNIRTTSNSCIALYDEEFNFIEGINKNTAGMDSGGGVFHVSEDVKYFRFTKVDTQDSEEVFIKTHETFNINFSKEDLAKELNIKASKSVIVCLGDSVTELGDYDQTVADLTNSTVYNCGVGGTRMSRHSSEDHDKLSFYNMADAINQNNFSEQIQALDNLLQGRPDSNLIRTKNNLQSIDWEKVDIITVFFGTNDYSLGSSAKEGDADRDNFNTYNVAGALNYGIEKIQTAYPKIKLLVITPTHRFFSSEGDSDEFTNELGRSLQDYCDTIIKVSNLNHIPVKDMYRESGFNKYNHDYYFMDGVHPNKQGDKLIGEILSKFINSV